MERALHAANGDGIAKKEKLGNTGNQILGHLRNIGFHIIADSRLNMGYFANAGKNKR